MMRLYADESSCSLPIVIDLGIIFYHIHLTDFLAFACMSRPPFGHVVAQSALGVQAINPLFILKLSSHGLVYAAIMAYSRP